MVWDGVVATALLDPTLDGLCQQAGDVAVIAVDMPIELSVAGPRRCDTEARPLLGPRRSSLFAPPVAEAIEIETYADANAWSKANHGHGISKQAWMLRPKIVEVRGFAAAATVHETFPELAFLAMNDDRPLSHPKRTWSGMAQRLALLGTAGIDLPIDLGPAGAVAADDMIDAAALAWSARRIAAGTAECVPADPAPGEATIWW